MPLLPTHIILLAYSMLGYRLIAFVWLLSEGCWPLVDGHWLAAVIGLISIDWLVAGGLVGVDDKYVVA